MLNCVEYCQVWYPIGEVERTGEPVLILIERNII